MKVDVKKINKIFRKNASDTQEYYHLRTFVIAQLAVDEFFTKEKKNDDQYKLGVYEKAIKAVPKLSPVERAFLSLAINVCWTAKFFEVWREEDSFKSQHNLIN